ncbi:MAG TPA: FemAB family XrtA/PEP-CTERM system-associated protein [Candidatus Sulfotelmatobacter sp.]|jgi:FemAB-related protein (PEP-CTERM system-associated)
MSTTMVQATTAAESMTAASDAAVTTRLATTACDAARWEAFVAGHPESTSYHAWAWRTVFTNSFGWKPYYLIAEKDGEVCGVLPLIWQRNWPITSALVSMPHLKGGGILANSVEAAESLLAEAKQLALHLKTDCLELRHASLSESCLGLPARTDKVTFVVGLERDEEKMLKALDGKARNMVRKSMKQGLTVDFDSEGCLEEFYKIYCENMRELGSPAYARRFFEEIRQALPANTYICIVRHQGKAIAGAFLYGFRNTIEAVWASSLYKYLDMKPNMFMYWHMFRFASERGYDTFDFGRCSIDSGTYRFKKQWGARELPLYWHQWRADGAPLAQPKGASPAFRLASWMWQRLPLPLTNVLGPHLIKYLAGI